jgi:hypothetical protein
MPWVTFNSIEFEEGRTSKSGKKYDCYVLRGMRKGFPPDVDAPYEKVFFDNSSVTIIEKGVARPGISVVQFLQKGCKPGDMLSLKNVRRGATWELESIENKTTSRGGGAKDYEPLSDEEASAAYAMQMQPMTDPSRPAAPRTPQMAPLNYTPAM